MNFYNKQFIRMEEDEEPKEVPENPMEKMMGSMMFDKKFIEQRKIFLWGAVDDKSAKDITNRLLYLEAMAPGKEITFYINTGRYCYGFVWCGCHRWCVHRGQDHR